MSDSAGGHSTFPFTSTTHLLSPALPIGVVTLIMNRPEAKNAISTRFLDQFHNHLHALRYDPSIRVLILRSTVDRVFCAGADLKVGMENGKGGGEDGEDITEALLIFSSCVD